MSRSAIHYAIQRDSNGVPAGLVWSSEIQAAGEAREKSIRDEIAEQQRQMRKPNPDYVEWAIKRGLW